MGCPNSKQAEEDQGKLPASLGGGNALEVNYHARQMAAYYAAQKRRSSISQHPRNGQNLQLQEDSRQSQASAATYLQHKAEPGTGNQRADGTGQTSDPWVDVLGPGFGRTASSELIPLPGVEASALRTSSSEATSRKPHLVNQVSYTQASAIFSVANLLGEDVCCYSQDTDVQLSTLWVFQKVACDGVRRACVEGSHSTFHEPRSKLSERESLAGNAHLAVICGLNNHEDVQFVRQNEKQEA